MKGGREGYLKKFDWRDKNLNFKRITEKKKIVPSGGSGSVWVGPAGRVRMGLEPGGGNFKFGFELKWIGYTGTGTGKGRRVRG